MASVRLYLLAVGAGIGLIAGAMVWVAAPPPTLSNSELAAAARDRLGMVDPAALPRPAAESVPESPPAAAAAAAEPAPAPAPEKVTPTEVLLYVSEGENAVQVVDQLVQAGLVGTPPPSPGAWWTWTTTAASRPVPITCGGASARPTWPSGWCTCPSEPPV